MTMPNYLTSDDERNFGGALLDVAQRAALEVVAPHLRQLQTENADLRARQMRESRRRLDEQVEAAIPDFREFDRDPRWHKWLLGIDLMSGRVRQQLLNEAIDSSDATRVRKFFDDFRRQAGQSTSTSAPGHTRSASSGKNFYSRDDITRLYEMHRKGAFTGREAEWNRIEQDIFAAQREGRIEQRAYMTK
jgi:hypothetical protein